MNGVYGGYVVVVVVPCALRRAGAGSETEPVGPGPESQGGEDEEDGGVGRTCRPLRRHILCVFGLFCVFVCIVFVCLGSFSLDLFVLVCLF